MSKLAALKYARALDFVCKAEAKEDVLRSFAGIVSLFSDSKFVEIIKSPLVEEAKKVALLTDKIKNLPSEFINLIKLLSLSKKLYLLPTIYQELQKQLSIKSNSYKAVLESDKILDKDLTKKLLETLEKRLGVKLELVVKQTNYNGVKVEIQDLGLRVDFSLGRIKEELLLHILRGI